MKAWLSRWKALLAEKDVAELARGSLVALGLRVGGVLVSYGFHLLLARRFGADVVGLYALTLTVFHVAALLAMVGTPESMVRMVAQAGGRQTRNARPLLAAFLRSVLPVALCVACLLIVASGFLGERVFKDALLGPALRIIALALPLRAVQLIASSGLKGLKRVGAASAFETVLLPALNIVGVLVLLSVAAPVALVPVLAHTVSGAVCAALGLVFWARATRGAARAPSVPVPSSWRILSVSWPMMVTAGMYLVMNWTDIIMLGAFRSTGEVGIYRIAAKVAMLASLPLLAVNAIAAPKIAEVYRHHGPERLLRLVKLASLAIFALAAPIVVVGIAFAGPLLRLFGRDFAAGSYCLLVLMTGQFVNAMCGSVGFLLNMTGHQRALRNVMLLAAGTNLVLNVGLIPPFGVLGAALATAASTVLWNLLASYHAMRIFNFWPGFTPWFNPFSVRRERGAGVASTSPGDDR
jgi:O-antigen/teichoic acid export membrane protein